MLERALQWWFNGGQQWHRSKLHLDCSSPSAVHPTRNRHSLDPPPPDRSRASSVRACVDGLLRDAEETSGVKAVAPAAGSGGGGGGGGGGIGGGGGSGGGGSGSGGGGGGGSGGSGGNHGHGGSRAAGSSSRDANAEREAGAGGSRSHNANGKRPAAYSSGHSPRQLRSSPPHLAASLLWQQWQRRHLLQLLQRWQRWRRFVRLIERGARDEPLEWGVSGRWQRPVELPPARH